MREQPPGGTAPASGPLARLDGELAAWLLASTSDGFVISRLSDGVVVQANEAYGRMTGYRVEEIVGRTAVDLGLVSAVARDGWVERLSANGATLEAEGVMRTRTGEELPVRVVARTGIMEGERISATLIRDLTHERDVERTLRRRGAILETVWLAADLFLHGGGWRDGIDEVLRRLGEAEEASRAYLLRDEIDDAGRRMRTLPAEWTAPGIAPLSSFDEHRQPWAVPEPFPAWDRALSEGGVIQGPVSELDPVARAHLEEEGVRSVAAVPIFAGGAWWGQLGFDDCASDREWSSDEVEALRTAAGILGASVEHELEQQGQREAEAKYRALVEQIPAVVYIDAPEGPNTTLYISPQTESMLGFSQRDWMSDSNLLSKRVHPDDRREWFETNARIDETGEPFSLEYRIIAADGRVVWVHDEAVLVRDDAGRPQFWHGVMFDITSLKAAEVALREAFERERMAAQRLRTLDEMKNTFLQAVSHELRTPLTAILGAALTLEREDVTLPPEESRDMLGRLAANARKLHRLLGDLLDLDRLQRGIIEPVRQPTDVGALVRGVVEESDIPAGRALEVDAGSLVVAVDAPKVERIVENLLANAVRHTPPGTPIWVRVRAQEGGVLICVEDVGPGVPEDQRAPIFEPFRQGGVEDAHRPGVGVGLSLVARFAELHGGRAWVEDRPGGGASFRVLLPGQG